MGTAPGGNNLWEFPLKVVRITFDNVALGKTNADTELNLIEDVKDIMHQQDGTQPHDKIPTGQFWQLVCTFSEIDTELVALMHDGATASGGGNSLSMSKYLFHSYREQAAELIVTAVDEDGDASADALQRLIAPVAYPQITGNFQFGVDTQRNLQITFNIFYDTTERVFFYSGYASSLGITP
jgi:hypothetical protein